MKKDDYQDRFFESLSMLRKLLRSKGCDEVLIEDVAQETFVRGYKACGRFFSIRGGFDAWISRIALNVLRSHIRKRDADTRGLERRAQLARRDSDDRGAGENDASIEYIRAAFQTLSPTDQGLLSRTLIDGDSPAAIAAENPDLNPNMVAQRAWRARARLRQAFLRIVGS